MSIKTLGVTHRLERLSLGILVAINVVFPLVLVIAGWPKPWRTFDGETSPINWLSSMQCAIIGALAFGVYVIKVLGRRAGTDPVRRAWPWVVFALGFLAMSADEVFEGHERIRDELLKPRGWFTEIGFLMPGDVVLIFYVVVGLALGYFLLADLRRNRASLVAAIVAFVLIGTSAFQDALDVSFVHNRGFRHFQTIAEELAEIWAQMLFAGAFVMVFFQKLRCLLEGIHGSPPRPEATPGPASTDADLA
jgi:hypothetical protein